MKLKELKEKVDAAIAEHGGDLKCNIDIAEDDNLVSCHSFGNVNKNNHYSDEMPVF